MISPDSAAKAAWRAQLLAARATVPAAVREREAAALASAAGALTTGDQTVCAFVPTGDEPGSLALLEALRDSAARVLLPVVAGDELNWAEYEGPDALLPGAFGISAPSSVPLPPSELSRASLVLVPALAVDRRGIRLGRGAGYYDRALHHADPAARLVAVVRDSELVDRLPVESHDRPIGAALTPVAGLTALIAQE
jgi:5-formyltetrahydrofolate cyclo-ligase